MCFPSRFLLLFIPCCLWFAQPALAGWESTGCSGLKTSGAEALRHPAQAAADSTTAAH